MWGKCSECGVVPLLYKLGKNELIEDHKEANSVKTKELKIDSKGYKHFKGGLYELVCEATDSETQEDLIVYKSLKDGKVWVRPKKMFFEKVEVNGKSMPRFEKLI